MQSCTVKINAELKQNRRISTSAMYVSYFYTFCCITGKVSKKERMRRRNKKLVKILQPKNAVMVLNEMVGTATYTLSENNDINPYSTDFKSFKASVLVDGIEHYGIGEFSKVPHLFYYMYCLYKYNYKQEIFN